MEFQRAGDVQEGLVDGERLDETGVFLHHLDDFGRGKGVGSIVAYYENDVGARLASLPRVHARLDAEGPGLVGRGGYHSPSSADDGDRLASQRRIHRLLNRSKKGILVQV